MRIPITRRGNDDDIIGWCTPEGVGMKVKFIDGANVTRAEFFKMFGCGCTVKHAEALPDGEIALDNFIIIEAVILTFILAPA